jgi:hypothetical protein
MRPEYLEEEHAEEVADLLDPPEAPEGIR